ncbi:MAG: DOMON domain-containing protein [Dehalogenimonas sp.]
MNKLLSLFLIGLMVTIIGCGPETSEPNPITEGWQADGIISSGEYGRFNTFDNGNYELHHHVADGYIYLGIKANTTGWVAVGFIPGISLTQVDFNIGVITGNRTSVYDHFAAEHPGEHEDDRFLDGTADIIEYGGSESNGVTVIEFKRLLNTGDTVTDMEITPGNRIVMWAYGALDDIIYHTARGFEQIRIG